MKRLCTWTYLLVGAFSLAISPSAAGQGIQPGDSITGGQSSYMKGIQQRLRKAEQQLAAIKAQANLPTTPQGRRVLAERLQPLEKEVEGLKQDVVAVEEAQVRRLNKSVNNPQRAFPNCPDLIEVENEVISGRPSNQSCPKTIEVIASRTTKRFDVSVSSDQIRLTQEANSFCIDFRSVQDGRPTDPGEVSAEATMSTRLLAVARVDRFAVGHYCAHVNFPLPGYWLITVKHEGSQGSGTINFLERGGRRPASCR